MFKKIQQYLLLHYPLLWNVKIVPVLAVVLTIHLALFVIGYFSTQFEDITSYQDYDSVFSYPLVWLFSILSILIILILWLVHYARNNAFRVFYPKSSAALYGEWLMVLLVVFGLFAFPLTHIKGVEMKVKSFAADWEEVLRNVKTINQIQCLMPTDKNSFFREAPMGYTLDKFGKLTEETAYYDDVLDSVVYKKTDLTLADFPNFTQFSLLNQSFDYDAISNDLVSNQQSVKQWLIDENKQEIRSLINNFLLLAQKHHVPVSITVDEWMERIYNPPTYPVTSENLFDYHETTMSLSTEAACRDLQYACENIFRAYYNNSSDAILLAIICLAGIVSLLIYSSRSTGRKSWLIALVSLFVLWVVYGVISVLIGLASGEDATGHFMLLFWIGVFAFELFYVLRLIRYRSSKKFSGVMLNHLFWMLPFVPMIMLGFYLYVDNIYYKTSHGDWIEDNFTTIVWTNVALTFATAGLLIHYVARRWKSLPEQ